MSSILDKLNHGVQEEEKELADSKMSEKIEFVEKIENHDEILEEVLGDSRISSEESPFQIYPDDKRVDMSKENIPDFREIVKEYRAGEIDTRVMNILNIIMCHGYITTRQIHQLYLLILKKYIKRDHLLNLLTRMVEKGLIAEYKCESAIGSPNGYSFYVDYNGARLYKTQYGKNILWNRENVIAQIQKMKRNFAANQLLIACLKHYDFQYEVKPKFEWKDHNVLKAVRPMLQMIFTSKENMGKTVFLVEVIRKFCGWENEYREKLVRYGQYFNSIKETQKLNKYYLIVCAESDEHIFEAIRIRYNWEVECINSDTKEINIYYTHDLKLLDHHIEKSPLNDMRAFSYNYETMKWNERYFSENFEEHDWHNMSFTLEEIPTQKHTVEHQKGENEKEKLALQIYQIVRGEGDTFPIDGVKLAPLLKKNNLDYADFGYKSLKSLIISLSEYYEIFYDSNIRMFVDCVKKTMNDDIDEEREREPNDEGGLNEIEDLKHRKIIENKDMLVSRDEIEESVSAHKTSGDAIINYFRYGFTNRKKWVNEFTKDIFWNNRSDVIVTALNRLIKNYDISMQGWLDIIAYCYCQEKGQCKIIKDENSDTKRICFDMHLCTFKGEKIYFIAKENWYKNPQWVTEGVATISSRVLGEEVKKMIDFIDAR